MNKAELVEEVTNYTGLATAKSREVVNEIILVITESLAGGEKVTLAGFGTFQLARRKARTGTNPQTGETIQIPGKRVPKFVPGKDLRDKVE